jgi:hypothetical protein
LEYALGEVDMNLKNAVALVTGGGSGPRPLLIASTANLLAEWTDLNGNVRKPAIELAIMIVSALRAHRRKCGTRTAA